MTGFGRSQKADKNMDVVTEIRSYNSKNLDINIRIPHDYLLLEEKIKKLVCAKISRGRIEIRIDIKSNVDSCSGYEIDAEKALAYYNALMSLKETLKIDSEITLEIISGAEGVIKPAGAIKDVEPERTLIESSVEEALSRLDEMKRKEGEFLAGDFISRLKNIENFLKLVERESKDLPLYYMERLKERILLLAGDSIEPDPGRIAQEAAFLADKCDVSEEILRAKSHIDRFGSIMNSGEPSGRKLNFLLQELNRELNTIGSKTEKAVVSHIVVDVKSEVEKIREQVQNIE